MLRFLIVAALLGTPALAAAQDPTQTLPAAYKVQFENDYVRIVRVHLDGGVKLPDHTHPAGTTLYVYLTDAEGVVFTHSGGSRSTITRPPVKAGAMRIAAGREEHHTVENTSPTASDFLRVIFKTDDAGIRNLRQRLSPADRQFENRQMRVRRITVEQHGSVTIDAKEPALLIELPGGEARWIDAGTSQTIEHHDAPDLQLIRVDFLTSPAKR